MNDTVYKMANQYKIKINMDRIKEEKKTEEAFKKLYSNYDGDLKSVLAEGKFVELRKSLMQSFKRKSLYKPSKYMSKFIKLDKKVRSTFDTFDSVYSNY